MSAAVSPAEPRLATMLADRGFLFVWLVGGLGGIVRWLQLLVLGIYTFEITGSPLLVALVPVMWMAPLAIIGPFMGALADQMNRKTLLMAAQAMIVTSSATLAVLSYLGELAFVHIALASLAGGIFWTTDIPIRRRLLGDLWGTEGLGAAMSLDSATGNATRMAGPLLGGAILQVFSIFGVFVISSAVFAICLVLIGLTPAPERSAAAGTGRSFVREFKDGLRFVAGHAALRRIFLITIAFNIWGFPFTSMIPVLGREKLGLDPFYVGMLSSMEGLGAFIGALGVAVTARPSNYFRIYIGGTIAYLAMIGYLSVISSVAGGPNHSFYVASATLCVLGGSSACFAAMQSTLTYLAAPPELRSRVLGVLTLCIGMGPIGFVNIGWMAETFGVSTALAVTSAEGLLAVLALWAWSGDSEPAPGRPPG